MNGKGNKTASSGTSGGRREAYRKSNAPKRPAWAPDTKRTVVYARSRYEEDTARQVETGRAYAIRVLGVAPDAVVVLTDQRSGMDPVRPRRPGVEELISRMAEFDRIVVLDVERLSRDQATLGKLGLLLANTGSELHATTSGRVAADAMSISGILTRSMARTRKRTPWIAAGPR